MSEVAAIGQLAHAIEELRLTLVFGFVALWVGMIGIALIIHGRKDD